MKLSFSFLGYEYARVELDLGEQEPTPINVVERGVKAVSRLWIDRMLGR